MKLKKILMSFCLCFSIMIASGCSCGKIAFTSTMVTINKNIDNYCDIPISSQNNTEFLSSNENIVSFDSGCLVGKNGGYSVITAKKGNKTAKMIAIVTGIENENAKLTFNTKNAKVFYTTNPMTLGVEIDILNSGTENYVFNAVNGCLSFSVRLEGETKNSYSSYVRLTDDLENTNNVVIKPQETKSVTVFFNIVDIDKTIIDSSTPQMFNIYFNNLCIGASKVSAWVR